MPTCNCGGNDNVLKLSFACKTLLHVESRILFKKVKCNLCLTILSSGYWTEKDKIHFYATFQHIRSIMKSLNQIFWARAEWKGVTGGKEFLTVATNLLYRIMARAFVRKTQGESIVKDVYHCIMTNHGDLELLVKVR